MAKPALTTFEAARYCGVSPYTIRNWIEAGKLRGYATPGGHRRIRREELDAFMEAHSMPTPEDFASGGKRVLLVERAGAPVHRLRRFLQGLSEELEVRTASDGVAAAWVLLTLRPNALVLSLDIAHLDGLDFIRRAKASPETSACHVLALTADPTVEGVQAALEAGALECLAGPLDLDALAEILCRLFPAALSKRSKKGRRR